MEAGHSRSRKPLSENKNIYLKFSGGAVDLNSSPLDRQSYGFENRSHLPSER